MIIIIKDARLIYNSLPNSFWIEVIETVNYLQNRLPMKSRNYDKIISVEACIAIYQSLEHIHILGSFMLNSILKEKRTKSDY